MVDKSIKISISQGQPDYELELLKFKLKKRSQRYYKSIADIKSSMPNQIFVSHPGKIEV